MATRYDQKTKDEVVSFIAKYNAEKGRGGQSAAVAKWNLNPVTVKSWMEKAGVDSPGRGGRKRKAGKAAKAAKAPRGAKPGRKPGKRGGRTAVSGAGNLEKTLNRMMKIQAEISALQAEYAALKDSL